MGVVKDFFTKGTLFGKEPDVMARDVKPVRGRGGADQFGRIIKTKSVKEKKAEKAKSKTKVKTTAAGVNVGARSYQDAAKATAPSKKGTVFTGEARTIADAKKRGSKTFINKKGKKLAAVTKEELAASGLTLRQYLNKQQGKTPVGGGKTTKSKTKKKVDRVKVRKKLGVNSSISAGGSDLYMGLNEGGMATMDNYYKDLLKK